ncbi:Alpha/beta hydrolase family protein [Hymenobacter daecheongensis DSM 21074]|uniref:Alpha/beta hydrolase family protein n=1 Tax=Hymenobacter daecheongensis DSM 21074 TaxID=1121955 RepID=A0A1M6FYL3_9BACT|nr:dienelactone hydrolase family protein [Hymenobacter daecheongensis]SHJ02727.1 Alpha/beta hydrolase family protein [Hymenobacter daecheongensis DSM 21074]
MSASAPLTKVEFLLTAPHHNRPFAIDARYVPNGRPKPVLVFIHGFKGFKDWGHFNVMADWFARQGFVFVKLNLSHNGLVVGGTGDLEDLEAFGQNNFSLELDDIGALLDALFRGRPELPAAELSLDCLALIGHSRGGGLALLKAAEDKRVKAVVTWAAIGNVNPGWPEALMQHWQQQGVFHVENTRTGQQLPLYFQIVEDYHRNRLRLDIPHNVRRKLRQPLLIAHGDQDETVPLARAHELKKHKPDAELLILPGVTHNFGGAHPWQSEELPAESEQAAEATVEFLRRVFST